MTCCDEKQVGEIWLSGESIASGYWNRPEQTQETFKAYLKDNREQAFLRTGDLGYISNGELFVTGRLKDVIIIRGRNHYPQDIELSIENSHPALQTNSGAAFSVEIEGEEKLVVVQEIKRTHVRQLNREAVVEAINAAVSLEHELAIETIVLLKPGSIDKTSSGKIQRHACRQKFLDESLKGVIVSESLSEAEKEAKEITQFKKSDSMKVVEVNTAINNDACQNSSKTNKLTDNKNKFHFNNNENILRDIEYELIIKIIRKKIIKCISNYSKTTSNKITLNSNFMGLGIDSMQTLEIADNLSKELNSKIDPNLIFEYPTIIDLSNYLVKIYEIKIVDGLLVCQKESQKPEESREQSVTYESNNNNLTRDSFHKNTIVTGEL